MEVRIVKYRGRPVDEMSREELLKIVYEMAEQVEQLHKDKLELHKTFGRMLSR